MNIPFWLVILGLVVTISAAIDFTRRRRLVQQRRAEGRFQLIVNRLRDTTTFALDNITIGPGGSSTYHYAVWGGQEIFQLTLSTSTGITWLIINQESEAGRQALADLRNTLGTDLFTL